MKNLFYFVLITFILSSKLYSQLPQDYPFKTLLDNQNNLFITGYDVNNDFYVEKYPPIGDRLWTKSYINSRKDRGMDIVQYIDEIDLTQFVYSTGYIYNSALNCNDIMLIKYNGISGDTLWTRKISTDRDSKAFGIVMDNEKNIYLTGYVTNKYNLKSDIITMKYNPAGVLLWLSIFNNTEHNLDDVGTHILVDNNFVYVAGYSYQGTRSKNDLVILTYEKENGNLSISPQLFHDKDNQIPTGFLITNMADVSVPVLKSRMAVGCVSDNPVNNNQTDYLTLCFGSDSLNTLRWVNRFNGAGNGEDVLTAVAKDNDGNVFVSGYSFNGINNNFDYASMKYSKTDGHNLWNPAVAYFDNQGGNDKASSIKVGSNNLVYIAGESERAKTGFIVKAYKQENNALTQEWSGEFNPVFDIIKEEESTPLKKGSRVDIDNLGNIIFTVFIWNGNGASYAIRKYDPFGNILFTIDHSGDKPADNVENPKKVNNIKRSSEVHD